MIQTILTFLLALTIGIGYLIWRSFLPSYVSEKGKNLATSEDIAKITTEIEDVKVIYLERLKDIEHQNALVLEQLRHQQQLRLAAAERRLQAHQEAFSLWRRLFGATGTKDVFPIVLECQDWWNKNCLYLNSTARDSFNRAYFAASDHIVLLQNKVDVDSISKNMALISRVGDDLVSGVELPSLGTRETENVTNNNSPISS
jgi:hypothetical protein